MEEKSKEKIEPKVKRDGKDFINDLTKRGIKNAKRFQDQLFQVLHKDHKKAVLVKDLFPEFKIKSEEHEFLQSCRTDGLIRPVGGGRWKADSIIMFTKEGREIARECGINVIPLVFVSYSRVDLKWKELLLRHMSVLEQYTHMEIWDDSKIDAGEKWKPEIIKAIDRADASILLISADFLGSEFIKNEEIPLILSDKRKDVFPILVRPCSFELVGWLNEIQIRSIEGKALSECSEPTAEKFLAKSTKEIALRLNWEE